MSDAAMVRMGELNRGWGICGFTSTFYAMYQANPATRGGLHNATSVFSVLYEISDYLKLLQASASPLINDITRFTQSFGAPYDTFTVPKYIQSIDKASANMSRFIALPSIGVAKIEESSMESNELFGIALPPQAVVDYIERVWKWRAAITEYGVGNMADDAIVGVRDVNNTTMKMYHGLCHYLYRENNRFYSWGQEFPTLAQADANFQICYAITIRKY